MGGIQEIDNANNMLHAAASGAPDLGMAMAELNKELLTEKMRPIAREVRTTLSASMAEIDKNLYECLERASVNFQKKMFALGNLKDKMGADEYERSKNVLEKAATLTAQNYIKSVTKVKKDTIDALVAYIRE